MTDSKFPLTRRIVEVALLLAAIGMLIPPVGSNDPAEYVARLHLVFLGSLAFFVSRLVAHGLRSSAVALSALEAAGFFGVGYMLRQALLLIVQ